MHQLHSKVDDFVPSNHNGEMQVKTNESNNELNEKLSAAEIRRYLKGVARDLQLDVRRSVGSTNRIVKEHAVAGEAEGLTVIAEEQTEGRGRLGRSFYSPAGTGIYLSMLLRPDLAPEDAVLLTTTAAVAVAEAIEEVSNQPAKIKWVNDVYLDGKKVCGILTEASFAPKTGELAYIVLGIGINVFEPTGGFPADIRDTAAAVFPADTKVEAARNRLIAAILNKFCIYYKDLRNPALITAYKQFSFVLGKKIMVHSPLGSFPAMALDIDSSGHLLVRFADGREEYLDSGEISIRLDNQ